MAIDPPRYDEEGNLNVIFHANPKNSIKNNKQKECRTPRKSNSYNNHGRNSSSQSQSHHTSIYYQNNNLSMDKEGKTFLFTYRLSLSKLIILAILDIIFLFYALKYFYPSILDELVNYFNSSSSSNNMLTADN